MLRASHPTIFITFPKLAIWQLHPLHKMIVQVCVCERGEKLSKQIMYCYRCLILCNTINASEAKMCSSVLHLHYLSNNCISLSKEQWEQLLNRSRCGWTTLCTKEFIWGLGGVTLPLLLNAFIVKWSVVSAVPFYVSVGSLTVNERSRKGKLCVALFVMSNK